MNPAVLLVVAKAPVAGRVKTRLAAAVGDTVAAELAAAALLDTLQACERAVGADRCHLALEGDLADAVHGERLRARLHDWQVHAQRGHGFAERLVHAHADVAAASGAPVVQIGMDTPQLCPSVLLGVVEQLGHDEAVLGDAVDGGWWVLGLRDASQARVLLDVEMSTEHTGRDTRAALAGAGLTVADAPVLRDVDTAADADAVVAEHPLTRFATRWSALHLQEVDA